MSDVTTCPEVILAAIPWYPDGLTREECGAVEAHAADCGACRAELAFLRGDEEPAIAVPDPEEVYARLLYRIEAPDDDASSPARPAQLGRLHRFSERVRGPVSIAAGLMVALLSGMLTTGAIWTVRVAPTYETAQALPPVQSSGRQLEIVFAPDATAREMADRLREIRGTVVSGPTPRGVYRVRLASGVDVEAALEKLRGDERGVVAFAEASRR